MTLDATQAAVYTALTGASGVTSRLSSSWGLTAVFNRVPQENADDQSYYPFISFRANGLRPFDDKSTDGGEVDVEVSVWWREPQASEGALIAEAVKGALHRQPLTIAGASHVYTEMRASQPDILDPDGHTSRAILQFTIAYQDAD